MRAAEQNRILQSYRSVYAEPRIDVLDRVIAELPRVYTTEPAPPRRKTVRWFWSAGIAFASAALYWSARDPVPAGGGAPSAPHAMHAIARASQRASDPNRSARAVVVLGPAALAAEGAPGPIGLGDSVPFGVLLRADYGATELRVAGRVLLSLDSGARIVLGPSGMLWPALDLIAGRISVAIQTERTHSDVEVPGTERSPLVVRLGSSGSEVSAFSGSFGVLAAEGGRWSAAPSTGEISVRERGGALHRGTPGLVVAGGPDIETATHRLPDRLLMEARSTPAQQGWVVTGLASLLAEVRIGDRGVPLEPSGVFRVEAHGDAPIRVVALDAAGRREQREVREAPAASPARGSRHAPSAGRGRAAPEGVRPRSSDPAQIDAQPGRDRSVRIRQPAWNEGTSAGESRP